MTASPHRERPEKENPTHRQARRHNDDDESEEFNDDRDQRLEGYDENEFDAEDKRKRREGEIADEDTAAHRQQEATQKKTPSRRGFAAMDKEKQREIASKGGKASHGGGRKPSKPRN